MLIYPTLDVFSYDVCEGLGQPESEVNKNRQNFQNKLPVELAQQLEDHDRPGMYVELLGQERMYRFEEPHYTGYYYPVRLNDSYALLLDCSYREHASSDDFQWVSGLKQCLEKKLVQKATLGQTWVLYASLLNPLLEDYDLIAQQCYQALLPHANWHEDKTGSSEFSGGKLFELWQEGNEAHHVVIVLFSSEKRAEELMPMLIQDELHWFWYRHKIIWAYHQSRQLERVLKRQSIEINNFFDEFAQKSPTLLKKANKVLQHYFELFNYFEFQIHTIETNVYNYQRRINKVQQRLSGLNIPNEFLQRTKETYLLQVQRDRAAFHLQLDLIRNIIASIHAQETHHHVHEISAVQRKVEWLEVFFVSFYAAEFSHILLELFHEKNFSEIGIVVWTALFGGLAAFFGLTLKEHLKLDRHFWGTILFALVAMCPLIVMLIWSVIK